MKWRKRDRSETCNRGLHFENSPAYKRDKNWQKYRYIWWFLHLRFQHLRRRQNLIRSTGNSQVRGKNLQTKLYSDYSVSSAGALISKHKMSHSLKSVITFLIIRAVRCITCENINNLYDFEGESGCVLVVSPDQTLERCKLIQPALAICNSVDFVGLKNCLPRPRSKSCLTCTAAGKKYEVPRVIDIPVFPTLPSKI